MGKLHLIKIHTKADCPPVYSVLEEGVEYIGELTEDGKISMPLSEDIIQADDISGLLHKIQDSGDTRFYAEMDFIDSNCRTRKETYPAHCELHILTGYVSEVCDIRTEYPYTASWSVRFISDLWARTGDEMNKVRNFTEKAVAAAKEYIEKEKLQYQN